VAISRASDSSIQDGLPKYNDIWDGTTATSAFDSLGSVFLSSTTTNVTFSNIPQTYTHLQIRTSVRTSRSDAGTDVLTMQLNGVTGNSYATHGLVGDGSSATSYGYANYPHPMYLDGMPSANATANIFGVGIIDILNYSNTNMKTTVRGIGGTDLNGSGQVRVVSGFWDNTNAVTSILFGSVGSYVANSMFTLYGIK
jgi:hypothetical protein